MKKRELIEKLIHENRINKSNAKLLVDCFFDVLAANLIAGKTIKIRNFGILTTKYYQPYLARNPRTRSFIQIQGRKLAIWKAAKTFKGLV